MRAELTFHTSWLETSHLRNDSAPGQNIHTQNAIPSHISYACLFWADHLRATPNQDQDLEIFQELIKKFLLTRLLKWLEVLSLLDAVFIATPSVGNVVTLFEVISCGIFSLSLKLRLHFQGHDDDLVGFAKDTAKFITAFQAPISDSAPGPHINVSSTPPPPNGSRVEKWAL